LYNINVLVSFSFSQAMEIPPTPAPAANESSRVVAETTAVIGADESLACTVELFTRDYDASQGNLTSIQGLDDESNKRKSPAPCVTASSPTGSPDKKKRPPPTSVPAEPKRSHSAMIGLVPKSEFFRFLRPHHFMKKGLPSYTKKARDKGLKERRLSIMNHFYRGVRRPVAPEEATGTVTRSSAEEIDDWVLDSDAIEVRTTDHRRLS
jgi:hypothetical protein